MSILHETLTASDDTDRMLAAVRTSSERQIVCAMDGHTPLHIAVSRNATPVVEAVLHRIRRMRRTRDLVHILVNQPRGDGLTCLLMACYRGNIDIVRMLLAGGADPNAASLRGTTPLITAAFQGHDAVVEALLRTPAIDVCARDAKGMDALMCAAGNGREAVVRMLLAHTASNIDATNHHGTTPLIAAAQKGFHCVARVLLEHGADPSIRTPSGWGPVHAAAQGGFVETIRAVADTHPHLLDAPLPDGSTPFMIACANQQAHLVEWLLAQGVDVARARRDGRNALMLAVPSCSPSLDVLKVLRRSGIDVCAVDSAGNDAEALARAAGHADAADFIGRWMRGADVEDAEDAEDAEDSVDQLLVDACRHRAVQLRAERELQQWMKSRGATPRLCALCDLQRRSFENKHSIVAMLLDMGADPRETDENGYTPLHHAVLEHDVVTCRMLLGRGAAVDARTTRNGLTPLYMASAHGFVDAMHLLIAAGADVDAAGADGATPLFIAAQEQYVSSMRVLLAHGADPLRMQVHRQTPLAIACRRGHTSAVRLLLGFAKEESSLARMRARTDAMGATPSAAQIAREAVAPMFVSRARAVEEGYVREGESYPARNDDAEQGRRGAEPPDTRPPSPDDDDRTADPGRGVGLQQADAFHMTPFQIACAYGHTPVALLLLPHCMSAGAVLDGLFAALQGGYAHTTMAVLDRLPASSVPLLCRERKDGMSLLDAARRWNVADAVAFMERAPESGGEPRA